MKSLRALSTYYTFVVIFSHVTSQQLLQKFMVHAINRRLEFILRFNNTKPILLKIINIFIAYMNIISKTFRISLLYVKDFKLIYKNVLDPKETRDLSKWVGCTIINQWVYHWLMSLINLFSEKQIFFETVGLKSSGNLFLIWHRADRHSFSISYYMWYIGKYTQNILSFCMNYQNVLFSFFVNLCHLLFSLLSYKTWVWFWIKNPLSKMNTYKLIIQFFNIRISRAVGYLWILFKYFIILFLNFDILGYTSIDYRNVRLDTLWEC